MRRDWACCRGVLPHAAQVQEYAAAALQGLTALLPLMPVSTAAAPLHPPSASFRPSTRRPLAQQVADPGCPAVFVVFCVACRCVTLPQGGPVSHPVRIRGGPNVVTKETVALRLSAFAHIKDSLTQVANAIMRGERAG